ncbi:DUF6444 domain-containing protein [Nocardia sp. NPDC058497]|uniref:DUF6444 domain-containing protein n=1 Tax=Nocardia sp. NPDC058497 TaxID=3346529 RepID=UPI003646B24B
MKRQLGQNSKNSSRPPSGDRLQRSSSRVECRKAGRSLVSKPVVRVRHCCVAMRPRRWWGRRRACARGLPAVLSNLADAAGVAELKAP